MEQRTLVKFASPSFVLQRVALGVSGGVVHTDQNRGQYVRPLGGSQIVEGGLDENPFTGGEQGKWVYTLSRC